MSEYLIRGETLEAIGDEVRRLTDTESLLSPAQMATALAGVTVGSNPIHDEYAFFDYRLEYPSELGEIGSSEGISPDENGSRLWALEYFSSVWVFPPVENLSYYTRPIVFNEGYDIYSGSEYQHGLVSLKMPALSSIEESWSLGLLVQYSERLIVAEFPALEHASSSSYPFENNPYIERIVLNSKFDFSSFRMLDAASLDHTVSLYLKGTEMGICNNLPFGDVSEYNGGEIPNLKIYVPPSLVDDFKTTWGGGVYANNIYADPEVSA